MEATQVVKNELQEDSEYFEDTPFLWNDAQHFYRQFRHEDYLRKLKSAMLARLKEAGIAGTFNALADGRESEFWSLVFVGLRAPDACDRIFEEIANVFGKYENKAIDVIEKYENDNTTLQEAVCSWTKLYDAAMANVDATSSLERHLLLSAASALGLSDPLWQQEDTQKGLETLFEKLARWSKAEQPQRSMGEALLQGLACDTEFSRAILQAVKKGGAPTFWELVIAGANAPDMSDDIIIEILQEYEENRISLEETKNRLKLAFQWLTTVAKDVRSVTIYFEQLAASIRLLAESEGLGISTHVRHEYWRRMNPHSLRHEGLGR